MNDSLFIVLALALVLWASPRSGIVVMVVAGLLTGVIFRFTRPRIFMYGDRKRVAIRSAGVVANEVIAGGRDIRVSNIADRLLSAFRRDIWVYARSDGRSRQWQMAPRLAIEIIAVTRRLVGVALGALWGGLARGCRGFARAVRSGGCMCGASDEPDGDCIEWC